MKEYTVVINGVEHTMQLSAEDAQRLGATEKSADAPANKARKSAANKGKS